MKIVNVVAVALIDAEGRVLVAQRPEGKSLAGLWEFPGGKIEPGETPEVALVRELAEELNIVVATEALEALTFVSHGYPDFHLLMLLYLCRDWQGRPNSLEGQPLRWATMADLTALPMPSADIPLLPSLRSFVAAG
jgi:8-oxo-dGTP diphosphatase